MEAVGGSLEIVFRLFDCLTGTDGSADAGTGFLGNTERLKELLDIIDY